MKFLLVLLGTLKILGIFLLAVLVFVLILVLVVLLTPLCYEMQGEKTEKIGGSFAIRWLFGAVHIEGAYDTEKGMQFGGRIFWFPLGGEKKEKKPRKKKKRKKEKAPEPSISMRSRPPAESPNTQEEPPMATNKPFVTEKAKQGPEEKPPSTQPPAEDLAEHMEKPRVRRIRMEDIPEEEPSGYQELPPEFFTGEAEEPSLEEDKKDGLDLQYFLHMPDKKRLLKVCFAFLKRVCRGVLPKNIYVQATIGMGDPALTGYILAAAGAAKAKFGKNLQIKGEFRHWALEDAIVRIKGKIIIGYLAYALLRLALSKPIWKIIKIYWKGSR